ncbi:MAG: prepilin-type N-terminal cleavage/methylation domain-containing protein [Candidatus Marinamargulisbacteria bacterium]|jgi:prepilin-type N-terminal cleavage/methylation domain-containing protein
MRLKTQQGFTLMEMLIVVTIIAILAAIVLPRFVTSSGQAKKSVHRSERQTINSQLELYFFHFGHYPEAMTDGGWGLGDDDGNGKSPDWQEYWPEHVPTACNQGVPWQIVDTIGRIDTPAHDAAGHE